MNHAPSSFHRPRRRLGQHFLHDPKSIERIVAAFVPEPGQHVVEIGPGLGALTVPLLRRLGRLEVIELDRDLPARLAERCAGLGELRIHGTDALGFDFCALAGSGVKLRIIGNLPYNISTPLIFHLLEQADCIEDMLFMLQKEVVARLAAPPGSRTYGRLSVMVQYACRVRPLFTLKPGAFRPPPKVDSTLVHLVPHDKPPVAVRDRRLFAELVTRTFGQRRKQLRNSLKGWLTERDITAAGLRPQMRPEELALKDFAALANRLQVPDDQPLSRDVHKLCTDPKEKPDSRSF
jgi:16S rRNA (adenine1518-N6/adenine1519-N6)-dimethyltransferase